MSRFPRVLVSFLVLFLVACVIIPRGVSGANRSLTTLAASSNYSTAGFDYASHHVFFAQSKYWLLYVSTDDVWYMSSSDGIKWSSPTGLHLGSIQGFSMTNDADHLYMAISRDPGIYFASRQMNPDGTVTVDPFIASLWLVSGSNEGVRLSIGVLGDRHVFIAYQVALGCGLCVADSVAPYTSWTTALTLSLQDEGGLNWPRLHSYKPGQMIVVSGNYANVWNNGWGSPTSLSDNAGQPFGYLFFVGSSVYLWSLVFCNRVVPFCLGYSTFNGTSWSPIQATNILALGRETGGFPPFTVTYDSMNNRFVVFQSDTTGSTIYRYFANANSHFYHNLTIASGRNGVYSITSFETPILYGSNTGIVEIAWTETGIYPYPVYTLASR